MNNEFNHNELKKRILRLESNLHIETNEVNRESFLRSISRNERNALVYVLDSLKIFKEATYFSAFAVGTTTYPDSYWHGLKTYLQSKECKELLSFAEKKGEDIDIQLCYDQFTSQNWRLPFVDEWPKFVNRDLKKAKIKFVKSRTRLNGTAYNDFPLKTRNGREVIRRKTKDYDSSNFKISIEGIRPIHLFFDLTYDTMHKLFSERVNGDNFSLLLRHGNISDLAELVVKINSSSQLFNYKSEQLDQRLEQYVLQVADAHRRVRQEEYNFKMMTNTEKKGLRNKKLLEEEPF